MSGTTGDRAGDEILIEDRGAVRILTINRPHRSNALAATTIACLRSAIVGAAADPGVRVIVLTGAGERAFCAGADLKDPALSSTAGSAPFTPGAERSLFEILLETYKPVIAALNGAAMGGGLEIALASDIRIAAEGATLGLPEARRGMGAHFASIMLPRMMPSGIAFELLFRGGSLSAEEGLRWGLVNRVVPPAELLAEAVALGEEIAANAPITIRRMKETALKAIGLPLAAALRLNEGISPYESEDREEGARAFVERRAPVWKGR